MTLITIEREGPIAVVTLNRPEAMNALSRALRREITTAFRMLRDEADIYAIVLTGAGERAFSAGVDLKELGAGAEIVPPGSDPLDDPVRAIEQCGKPIIGAINGVAITGGFELALGCDILIGSTNARFADTHARVGIMPGWGLSQKLSRIMGLSRAKEMSLTGNFIDAATAERWGLLNRVVAPGELLATAKQLARDVASIDPRMVAAYKTLIDDGYASDFATGMALEQERSNSANADVDNAAVEARRRDILARGRAQHG